MLLRTFFALLLAATLLSGCKSIDNYTFHNNKKLYVQNAQAAAQAGDWENAARRYFLALQNAQWAEASPKEQAQLNYEVGRARGVTCKYDLADVHLKRAYELEQKAGAPPYRSLVELARLSLAQKKYSEAIGYFERALPQWEKAGVTRDPTGFADALDDYAVALAKSNQQATANSVALRAKEMRTNAKGKPASEMRAPYGTQCVPPST